MIYFEAGLINRVIFLDKNQLTVIATLDLLQNNPFNAPD